MPQVDRCCNPFEINGHRGKDLRKISKSFLKDFPDLPDNSKICTECRKKRKLDDNKESLTYNVQESDNCMEEDNFLNSKLDKSSPLESKISLPIHENLVDSLDE